LLLWQYLKDVFTGDFCKALAGLFVPEAPGLSASTMTGLKEVGKEGQILFLFF